MIIQFEQKKKYFIIQSILLILFFSSIFWANTLYRGFEIFWLLFLGVNLILWGIKTQDNIRFGYQDIVIFLFTIYFSIHYFCFENHSFTQIMFWVFLGYIICFFYFKDVLKSYPKIINLLLISIVVIACIESFIALLQYNDILSSNNDFFKLTGTFYSPNILAFYISLSFITLLWKFIYSSISTKHRVIYLFLLILFLVLIILIEARSSWLAILIGLFSLTLSSKKATNYLKKVALYKKTIFFAIISIGLVFSFTKAYNFKKDSSDSRLLISKITFNEIQKKPFFGHGIFSFRGGYNKAKADYFSEIKRPWNEIKLASNTYHAFNEYLYITYEIGIIGLLFVLVIIFLLFYKLKLDKLSVLAITLLSMIFILSLVSYPIYVPHIAIIGILAATIIALNNKSKKFEIKQKATVYLKKSFYVIVGLLMVFISINKIQARLNLIKFHNNQAFNETLNIKELISLFNSSDDIGESNFYLGNELYKRGFIDEGIKRMAESFPILMEPKMGEILAESYMNIKNYSEAEKIFKINIANESFRYKPRMDYGILLKKCNRLYEQSELLKEVINLPVKIPSSKINNYKEEAKGFLVKYKDYIAPNTSIKGSLSIDKGVRSTIFNKTMRYKIYLPSIEYISKPLPVIYFTDGQLFSKNKNFIQEVDNLIHTKQIKPIAMVFTDPREVGNNNLNLRNQYYICNPDYANYFIDELLPTIESRSPISSNRNNRVLFGQSFGGLFSAYLIDKYPEYFKNLVMQSPAFHPCPSIYESYQLKALRDFNVYMSYGTLNDTENQDIPMIDILRNKGYNLKVNRVEGGEHSQNTWMKQIDEILKYYFQL